MQQVLMTVNIALRRQLWQLDYFSEGSIPDALIGVPAGWTGIGEDGVEQSFSATDLVKYGADGSIRTDVIMRDVNGRVIAIWDIKTGNAELTDERRQEIRQEVGVSDDVPVIELDIRRGARH